MRVILTGATGFIGQRLASLLQTSGHEVACLVRPATEYPVGVALVVADLSRSETIEKLPTGDVLIHLAQSTLYRGFPTAAGDIFSTNVASTARLLDLARRNGTRSFVLASTGSVYSAHVGPCSEDMALRPDNFYAASKVAAEALLRPYTSYFHTCALRLFTPYGPGQRDRLIPALIERVRNHRPVDLDGEADGLQLSLTYVDDVASVFRLAVEQNWEGAYNVAGPKPASIVDIAATIGKILELEPLYNRTGRREQPPLVADVAKLAQFCDVDRFLTLENGIQSIVLGTAASS